jgi:hypothetical protein
LEPKFSLTPPEAIEPRSQKNNRYEYFLFIQKANVERQGQNANKQKPINDLVSALLSIVASLLTIFCN